eukprot:5670586-Prorocentrum_lima.AAC.1
MRAPWPLRAAHVLPNILQQHHRNSHQKDTNTATTTENRELHDEPERTGDHRETEQDTEMQQTW